MKAKLTVLLALIAMLGLWSCAISRKPPPAVAPDAQVPKWSPQDMEFFLHGSMSSEFVPENVMTAFIVIYPDLFPSGDLSNFGLIADRGNLWPIGLSRSRPAHLANLPSVGLNCAACHLGEVESPDGARVRVLGMTSHFDVEAFFNAVIAATFRTQDPANMKLFLSEVLYSQRYAREWENRLPKISAAIAADPGSSQDAGPGGLHQIDPESLKYTDDDHVPDLAVSYLKLFHNMRAALHVPDEPPKQLPPSSGPGRNDAFGLLSAVLFQSPQPYAPVKFGVVWNLENRHWVHWDADTQSPIARNMLASLGLGAPLIGTAAQLDFAAIDRQTTLSEKIKSPKYPFAIDRAAASRGKTLYQTSCASCHDGDETDARLYSAEEIGTDPLRAKLFTPMQAEHFNKFLSDLQAKGYNAATEPGVRSTQKYFAAGMAGVWARSPYLHNGSVRTMQELLTAPASRPATWHRGSRVFDPAHMGYIDAGEYLFDTKTPGNFNSGHDYGTDLSEPAKRDLIEFLKTM